MSLAFSINPAVHGWELNAERVVGFPLTQPFTVGNAGWMNDAARFTGFADWVDDLFYISPAVHGWVGGLMNNAARFTGLVDWASAVNLIDAPIRLMAKANCQAR